MAHRYLVAGLCLPFLACASAGGGSTGTAGTTGSGGTTGAGGTSAPIAGLGMGGPFTFPQNKASGSCTLTTAANASATTMSAYNSWKSTYVVSGSPGLRVQRPENGNDTVSEGIGYGMLAAVYVGDQATFDGLWTFAQAHFDTFTGTLMNWHLAASGATASDGVGSATDGDEDMAWALLMASDQWNSTAYLTAAQNMIEAMFNNSVFPDGTMQNGDHWSDTDAMNMDYFSPAYYRVFAKATNNQSWSGIVIDANYKHLAAQGEAPGMVGLVPDESNLENSLAQGTACPQCKPNYGYDACRMPWRIAMDYCFNSEPRALTYLQKIGPFFNSVSGGAGNIGDGYMENGTVTSSNHNSAFIGPAGTAGMAGYPALTDSAFNFGVSPPNAASNNSYFAQSLKVVTMLMMSGNFLDYTQLQ
jgi:endo-1,4-beta-D-glucanase Y